LEARDAVLDADLAGSGGANACLIWQAFAKRGMGADADDTGNPNLTAVTDGFAVPGGCEPVCGNTTVELGEDCDDGGTTPGDGCSATCRAESVVNLYGTAQGGTVTLVVDGVSVQVTTTPAQTAASVLAALAAEINGNPTLQGLGVTASVVDGELVVGGDVSSVTVGDPGLSEEPQGSPPEVPALGAPGAALLVALLGAGFLCCAQPRRNWTRR
jgi:cysteine-rich repeat protein